MTVGSLFAGIGGFDLGLERAGGFTIRWQVERDEWCRKVLAKHWPDVKRYGAIEDVDIETLEPVDVVCGGIPCQPHSIANITRREGIDDEERWLWPEFARVVRGLRPRVVLLENVSGIFTVNDGRAFSVILGELASLGYDCEWDVLPATYVGALHHRKRLWLVAYPHCERLQRWKVLQDGSRQRLPRKTGLDDKLVITGAIGGTWKSDTGIRRVADGIPNRMDRLVGLGNSVVSQMVTWLGKNIATAFQGSR